MSYVINACDCESASGWLETLESITYTDNSDSAYSKPTLPTSIAVEVADPFETCGIPSVELGEQSTFLTTNGYRGGPSSDLVRFACSWGWVCLVVVCGKYY